METASDWLRLLMPQIRERDGRPHESRRAFAERLRGLGVDLSAKALARIESGPDPSGRTRGVTLDEALQLAYALNVAPVHLMTPRGDDQDMQITPKVSAKSRDVRAWIRGERPLPGPGVDEIAYRQEVPESERDQHVRTATTVIRDLADAIDRASGDERRRRAGLLAAVVRELFDPLEVEWRPSETETEVMEAVQPDDPTVVWMPPDDPRSMWLAALRSLRLPALRYLIDAVAGATVDDDDESEQS